MSCSVKEVHSLVDDMPSGGSAVRAGGLSRTRWYAGCLINSGTCRYTSAVHECSSGEHRIRYRRVLVLACTLHPLAVG